MRRSTESFSTPAPERPECRFWRSCTNAPTGPVVLTIFTSFKWRRTAPHGAFSWAGSPSPNCKRGNARMRAGAADDICHGAGGCNIQAPLTNGADGGSATSIRSGCLRSLAQPCPSPERCPPRRIAPHSAAGSSLVKTVEHKRIFDRLR